jgi:serine/threonine protein kinase
MDISKIKPTAFVYNKKQMIGKGSFGEVYMGYNEKDHSPVAVKIVSF